MSQKAIQSTMGLILTISFVALGLIDLVAAFANWESLPTVSDVMYRLGWTYPFVNVSIGYCLGHLTGYMRLHTLCPKCGKKGEMTPEEFKEMSKS